MKKNIIIIGIIILLLSTGFFSGCLELSLTGDGEYHTGFSNSDVNNCETEHIKIDSGNTPIEFLNGEWIGQKLPDYEELILSPYNNAPIVTAMNPGTGKRSVEITCSGNIIHKGSMIVNWDAMYGWYIVEIKYDKLSRWKTIINTKNNQINDEIVSFVSGSTSKQQYFDKPTIPLPGYVSDAKSLQPIVFSLRDTHVGILKVTQMTEFHGFAGAFKHVEPMSVDHAFLISGDGKFDFVEQKTRYIAGVDTIKFDVDTGYSGYTQGGDYIERGWELKIYDNYGDLKKTWKIGDDKKSTRHDKNGNLLDYKIPADAYSSGVDHQWTAVLTNTLFEQDYKQYFVITQEELQQAPDIKTITFGDTQYHLGDTVVINLEGIPNPEGRKEIDGFLVNLRYGGVHSMDFVEDYQNKYISSSGTTATISFRATKGDTYVTVEAWAFDYPKNQGGIMSEKTTSQVWIKDEKTEPIPMELWPILAGVAVFAIFAIIAVLIPLPVHFKIIIIVIGGILAYVTYLFFP